MQGQNRMFRGADPTWANACVGDNGNPSFVEYAKGFSTAANLLIEKVLDSQSIEYSVDELIYPICFNMRHSVELRLKGTVSSLERLSEHRKRLPKFDFETSHDLGKIWQFIKEHSVELDKRYSSYVVLLDAYISNLADVDPTGQTFRYPTNQESEKHLTDVSVINVVVLKESFSALEELLDELNLFNEAILQEYSQGTYTAKLSRHEIYRLARELPPRDTWKDDSFTGVKDAAKKYFGLSSNEFSKAIRKIQSNFEMAALIEKTPPLENLESESLGEFFDAWTLIHDLSEVQRPSAGFQICDLSSEASFNQMRKDSESSSKALEAVYSSLDCEVIGELTGLYYFANYLVYSETYTQIVDLKKAELSMLKGSSQPRYKESILHLLNKTDALQKVITSLLFLNQASLANYAISRYELPETLEWLNRARNREPFSHLSFLGYGPGASFDPWLAGY